LIFSITACTTTVSNIRIFAVDMSPTAGNGYLAIFYWISLRRDSKICAAEPSDGSAPNMHGETLSISKQSDPIF
jgi:hypothetical protein